MYSSVCAGVIPGKVFPHTHAARARQLSRSYPCFAMLNLALEPQARGYNGWIDRAEMREKKLRCSTVSERGVIGKVMINLLLMLRNNYSANLSLLTCKTLFAAKEC